MNAVLQMADMPEPGKYNFFVRTPGVPGPGNVIRHPDVTALEVATLKHYYMFEFDGPIGVIWHEEVAPSE